MIWTTLFATLNLWAFIPPATTVFDRLTSNQGSGTYRLEQDVQISTIDGDSITIQEEWTVFSNSSLSLRAKGVVGGTTVFNASYNYIGAQKQFKDDAGQVKSSARPKSFYIDLFFTSSRVQLESRLRDLNILPTESEGSENKPESLAEISYDVPFWQRISRKNGLVNYKFSLNHRPQDPALWVAQDEFFISGLRLSDGTTIFRNEMEKYRGSLKWPAKTSIRWRNNDIRVELSRLERIEKSKDLVAKMRNPESLKPAYFDPLLQQELANLVRDFYSEVR